MRKVERYLWPIAIVGLTLLWNFNDKGLGAVWLLRWILLQACLLAFLIRVRAKNPIMLFSFYVLLNALAFSTLPLLGVAPKVETALRLSAASAALCYAIGWMVVTRFFHQPWKRVFWGAGWFMALSIAVADASGWNVKLEVPILHNPSTAGTFLALLLAGMSCPVAWLFWGGLILLMGNATPLLALSAAALMRFFILGKNDLQKLAAPFLAVLLALLAVAFNLGKLGDGNGRFPVWHQVLSWMWHQPLWVKLFGTGLGSTPILVPIIQFNAGTDPNSFQFLYYLHNDWLQIFFELGLVGLLLALALFGFLLWKSRERPPLAARVMAFGTAMLISFPLHAPLLALLALTVCGEVLLEPSPLPSFHRR